MEKYDNLGMVGEGSYGMVMKCKHKESGQIVAIKKFLESEDDKMVKKIAMREVRMLRKLRHENLVNLIEVFRRRKRLYLVFEFVDHTVLDDLEKYPNGLSEMSVRKILWQVLRGVEFCHSHNIIHRDIKPENILNSRSGVIKLCDFGFARTLAAPGEVYTDYVATRWYRAPELLVGDTKYGRAIDIWAIGCLVGEMLVGDPIFPGKSDLDQLSKILKCVGNLCPRHREIFQRNPLFAGMRLPDVRDVEPLEKKFPKFSSEVLDLMKQCLRLDPNDRPSSSMLLRHEFFKKDNFEEKVIPELRARILKDAANNMLVRKESNKEREQERERKKKKIKEIIANSGQENQATDHVNTTSKKSPEQKSVKSNSPKKPEPSNSPKKQESSIPAKENLPKSILKNTSIPNTPGNDTKTPRKNSEKKQESKSSSNSSNVGKQLPNVDPTKQASSSSDPNTPRPSLSKTSFKEQNTISFNEKTLSNMPQISKKKSSEELYLKSVPSSRDGPTQTPEKVKSEKTKKTPTRRDGSETQEQHLHSGSEVKSSKGQNLQSGFEVKSSKSKNFSVARVPSDTVMFKEKNSNVSDKDRYSGQVNEQLINSKVGAVSSSDSKSFRKETRKSPKSSESPTRQGSIPPIISQDTPKNISPELYAAGSSPSSSSPLYHGQKPSISSNNSFSMQKSNDKAKKHVTMKLNDSSPQSSFDRAMYSDKTSHFEKMMMSMSGTTSITHPALKKSHAGPPTQSHLTAGTTGPSNAQYVRHYRDDKLTNLPLWSSVALDEKTSSLHSSLENSGKGSETKMQRTSEDLLKPREKSHKSKKDGKNRNHNQEERMLREHKTESQVTRLPGLGRKLTGQDYSPMKYGILEGSKVKKVKSKALAGMPSLDVASMAYPKPDRSPSPTNHNHHNVEGNFPSVYSKH